MAYDDFKNRLGNLTLLEKPINIVAGNDFYTAKQVEYGKSGNYLTRSLVALTDVGQNTSISRINAKLEAFPRGMQQASKSGTRCLSPWRRMSGRPPPSTSDYGRGDEACFLRPHLADPRLQRPQLLGVFVAGLVVGGNGSGDGRERNACGGRISISAGSGSSPAAAASCRGTSQKTEKKAR